MLPVVSSRLLVAQTAVADPSQPWLAAVDGLSGVAVNPSFPGVASISAEKYGTMTTTHYINWAAGVVMGEVTIESSDEPSYTGPWVVEQVVTFSGGAPKLDKVVIEGAFGAIRHRITQPVVGGSVTTKLVATA